MQTYSHLLIAAVLRKTIKHRTAGCKHLPDFRSSALMFGAALPDLPLILTTLVCLVVDWFNKRPMPSPDNPVTGSVTGQLFNDWFFNNPWVIAEHNMFHSPTSLVLLGSLAYWLWLKNKRYAGWIVWLMIGCMLHTLCDIPVHHDDGPLLFFPLNWDYRYMSPISYWDPARYGRPFVIFEHLLDLCLLIMLTWQFITWRRSRRASQ